MSSKTIGYVLTLKFKKVYDSVNKFALTNQFTVFIRSRKSQTAN